ncbi:addiction module protein [bacterium]|nr:addiction module protein [bacterium]
MGITLPLEQMSTEEKIQAMETIWDNLCKKADSLSSPSWHKNILLEREKRIKNGDEEFVDWDEAKKYIQNKTS